MGPVLFGDVNGDARSDALGRDVLSRDVEVALSDGSSFGPFESWGALAEFRALNDLALGDVNFDGLDDLVGRDPTTGQVWVARSNGASFESGTVWGTWPTERSLKVVDVDGDGSVDLAGRDSGDGQVYVGYSDDTAFEPGLSLTPYSVSATDDWELADANTDFAADLIVRSGDTVRVGLFTDSDFGPLADWGSLPADRDALFGDIDGDGAADPLGFGGQSEDLTLSSSTEASFEAPTPFGEFPTGHRLDLIDGDASGQADIVGEHLLLGDLRVALTDMAVALNPPAGEAELDPDLVYDLEDETLPATDPLVDLDDPTIEATPAGNRRPPLRLGFQDERRLNSRGQIPDPNPANPQQPYVPEGDAYGSRADELDGLNTPDKTDGLLTQYIYRHLKAAGGARPSTKPVMRFAVLWGQIENSPAAVASGEPRYFFDKLDRAVEQARDQGFHVCLTLTGITDFECKNRYNPNMRACASGPTGLSPDPVQFGEFAAAVAGHYKDKVAAYGIWNEPNNAVFLRDGAKRAPVHVLYRRLYIAAYNRIKRRESYDEGLGYKDARVFIGEFAHFTRPCAGAGCPRRADGQRIRSIDALKFLELVAEPHPESDAPVRTHGVAWHPYQHVGAPNTRGRLGVVGIGRTNEIQNLLTRLARRPQNGQGPRPLVTPKARVPPLFFTEFGYFNGPDPANRNPNCNGLKARCGDGYYKSEEGKAALLRQALTRAQSSGKDKQSIRWMILYQATEISPQNYVDQADEFNDPDAPPTDPAQAYQEEYGLFSPTGEVTGTRPYGKGPNPVDENRQPRLAFCAVYDWARVRGYQVSPSPCSQ